MSAPQCVHVLLLSKEASGERFWQCRVISPELGGVVCLLRRSSGSKKTISRIEPDLFDTARVQVRKPSGSEVLYFVEDYEPLVRRSGLGSSYRSLQAAAFWANLLGGNLAAVPADAGDALFGHVSRAFDLLQAGHPPLLILFKGVYLLLKLEGYPVRESWWQDLSAARRSAVARYLQANIEGLPDDLEADLAPLFEQLCHWARVHTDLQIPDKVLT